jgi:DHA3 family tetracycline resistance protein-like MFS transporter
MTMPRIFRPLRIRDFALLWVGMSISLLGDGIYLVAIAWQVYDLSNAPTALSVVGVAWTVPLVVFVLVGGVASDRFDRRKVMIVADLVRFVGIGALGILSLAGALELWHVIALVAVYGAGEAFFGPAFGAIVPDIVQKDDLVQANSINQLMRPLAYRLIGPALGGLAIAWLSAGGAFLLDASSFLVSALAFSLMSPRRAAAGERETSMASVRRELAEGFRFVCSRVWLWGTLIAASVTLLVFWGPYEVLVPYIVKNQLGGGSAQLGLVFAAGGVGSIVAALWMGTRGLPHRHITVMYVTWTLAGLAIAGYGFATELWQAMAVSFAIGGLETAGLVVWGTLIHRLVPTTMLGRVESFDWLVSIALVPVSFALTGPVAGAVGVKATIVGAAVLGAVGTLPFLFLRGMRDTERDGSLARVDISGANPVN